MKFEKLSRNAGLTLCGLRWNQLRRSISEGLNAGASCAARMSAALLEGATAKILASANLRVI